MGCLFPKAEGLRRYWANIVHGVDAIREIPETHWNPADYHDDDPKAPDRTYAGGAGSSIPSTSPRWISGSRRPTWRPPIPPSFSA